MTGAALAPAWIVILDASEAWGMPPWKLGGGTRVLWFARFEAYRGAKIEARRKMEKGMMPRD